MDSSNQKEHRLILAWLGLCVVLGGGVLGWGVVLGGGDASVERMDDQWLEHLARAEAMIEAGENESAADFLTRLEPHFPATFSKHHLDRERERLFELLARACSAMGRKREALDACLRLTEYDPRNWHNWELLANTNESFGELEAARAARLQVLQIHPSHLPTVTKLILADARAGRCQQAVAGFEAYLDAFVLARVHLGLGEPHEVLELPADGRPHTFDLPLALEAAPDAIELALEGWSVTPGAIAFAGPLAVGDTAPRVRVEVTPAWSATGEVTASGFAGAPGTSWSATGVDARLTAPLDPSALPAVPARVHLELTVHKAVGPELWAQVEACYASLGADERRSRAAARTVIGGCLQAGSVFED